MTPKRHTLIFSWLFLKTMARNLGWSKPRTTREVEPLRGDGGLGFPRVGSTLTVSSLAKDIHAENTRAYRILRAKLDNFDPHGILDSGILDMLIDMPATYRISHHISSILDGCPLGYFTEIFKYHMVSRGLSQAQQQILLDSIMIVGKVVLLENFKEVQPPVPNTYVNQQGVYSPVVVRSVIKTFELRQVPLSRVSFDWRFPIPFEDTISFDEAPVVMNYDFTGRREIVESDEELSFESYYRLQTLSPTGSETQFYCFTDKSFLYKRYRSVTEIQIPERYMSHIMRSAGLRQVIHYSLTTNLSGVEICTLFCPGGNDGNCFDSCIENSLCLNYTNQEYRKMYDDVIESVVKGRKKNDFFYYYQNGYSTYVMNLLADCWFNKYKVAIFLFRRNSKGSWVNIIKCTKKFTTDMKDYYYSICLFQVTDSGNILDLSKFGADGGVKTKDLFDNGGLGHMLHIVSVFPSPESFVLSEGKQHTMFRDVIGDKISDYLSTRFKEFYVRNKYWVDISSDDLKLLVELQLKRYKRGETNTLIFSSQDHKRRKIDCDKQSSNSPDVGKSFGYDPKTTAKWIKENVEKQEGKPMYYVIAYDLETVDNDKDQQHRVYEPFRQTIPSEGLEPKEFQIPWSCQWVGVNVSDEGNYLNMKKHDDCFVNDYSLCSLSLIDQNVFLNDPVTEYGVPISEDEIETKGYYLGSCVEKMLVSIANFVYSNNGKVGYLYAHNGASFDSYVVLQYQRFQIQKILKTSRGIMSVSLRVPISEEEGEDKFVTLILRDTKLHVPGSLSRLCKGFNVPSKFCKLDFPIQFIDMKICYRPAILKISKPYGENDVLSLACIIKSINNLIANSQWRPADYKSLKPPIAQFITCMSMIRKSTENHFLKIGIPRLLWPKAIDIPALRSWLISATIGGRVNAYAKTYCSPFTENIIYSFLKNDTEMLKEIYVEMLNSGKCMQTLDFTSLYPYVMSHCAMPTHKLYYMTKDQCIESIEIMKCETCEKICSLCSEHKVTFNSPWHKMRPFAIIIVKNVRPSLKSKCSSMRNMCGRKVYNKNTGKCVSLNYSLETNEEFEKRNGGKFVMRDVESFTNIDLYWMKKQGFVFEVVGGFGFTVSGIYNSFIEPAFLKRIEAKKQGNKLLSDFMKLNYNGSFGVTTQQDITESCFVASIPENLKDLHPSLIQSYLQRNGSEKGVTTKGRTGVMISEELTGEAYYFPSGQGVFQKRKKEHLSEYFMEQSPMQIGAAVLSYARHVANLVMFSFDEKEMTYTDTDSIAISDSFTSDQYPLFKIINNRDDALMGTLKNDHAENNGTNPRIFLSWIGGKKVKCHCTLNAEGQVKIFNTFKGLNISLETDDNNLLTDDYAEYRTTMSLLDINYFCEKEPEKVQSWSRELGKGVSITNHMQHFETETYLGDCVGVKVIENSAGRVEMFIPHGYYGSDDDGSDGFFDYDVKYNRDLKKYYLDKSRVDDMLPWYGIQYDTFSEFVKTYYKSDKILEPYSGGKEYDEIVEIIKKEKEE